MESGTTDLPDNPRPAQPLPVGKRVLIGFGMAFCLANAAMVLAGILAKRFMTSRGLDAIGDLIGFAFGGAFAGILIAVLLASLLSRRKLIIAFKFSIAAMLLAFGYMFVRGWLLQRDMAEHSRTEVPARRPTAAPTSPN